LDPNSAGGGLDVTPCNQQGTPLHVYGQGIPKPQPSSQFVYYTVSMTFIQSTYSPTPQINIPSYYVGLNSTTRIYPQTAGSLPSSSYYDFDLSSSGNYHPSWLLNTQAMGKDTFLTLLPKASSGAKFAGTLLSMSLYDRVMILDR
jgi:hypothetical protein